MALLKKRHRRVQLKERGRPARLGDVRGSLNLPSNLSWPYHLDQCYSA